MEIKNITFKDSNEFIDKLTKLGLSSDASDIHITPGPDNTLIKFRVGGELKPMYTFSNELYSIFVNTIKVRCGMDISEHNHIQDGKIFLHISLDGAKLGVNLRISSLPTLYGENIVMRILLNESKYLEIDSLGFSEDNTLSLKEVSDLNEGLILVCGGTGSGKTTTIYSLLNSFDKTKMNIFTLEDPVEYQIDGYIQSEVHSGQKAVENGSYSFGEGLIGILRQDPDIIMIGELRRKEESKTCFEAANTGHIVLGTIHSNNAVSVITRIRQFGIESYLIASGLKYIVSQKIIKSLCQHCKQKITIRKPDLSERFQKFIDKDEIIVHKNNPDGCEKCVIGFSGISLIGEIIKVNDSLYNLLLDNSGETEIRKYLSSSGFLPYYIDAFKKSISGQINIDHALKLEY